MPDGSKIRSSVPKNAGGAASATTNREDERALRDPSKSNMRADRRLVQAEPLAADAYRASRRWKVIGVR